MDQAWGFANQSHKMRRVDGAMSGPIGNSFFGGAGGTTKEG
jgi:hypothetical protein